MPDLTFNIPNFPLQGRFSDPYRDFDGMEEELARLAAKPPGNLTSIELYRIFNSFLPAGSFGEMAPYLPHALRRVQQDRDAGEFELMDSLITWCHVERAELERHPQLRDSLQEAFMLLFEHWTSNTDWHISRNGEPTPIDADMISVLLEQGDWIAENGTRGEHIYPWLRSAHYLPHIHALDSVPHAAWTLWFSDHDCTIATRTHPISTAQRRRAVEMVEEWLMSPDASEEDMFIWDPVLIRHRELLYLFPDAP